ncbi:MAG: class I SAM-dependent methyltransferase [Dysgonamonadaceae bacterium]|jgi:ubiquinone/menaquinone biosynthesis C-methylase UbiE|nr:class I SAM-dependent methyltransferase [Dysgonamonadaceae bacterium]
MKQLLKRVLHYYKHQQFFPDWISIIINPFFFHRYHLSKELKKLAKTLTGKLLDVGCGSKPYQSLFKNISSYTGIDVENEGHSHETEDIDVYYDGKRIPFDDQTFDSILCCEVLEHVPNLNEMLSEINRVLKPDGKFLLTVPFVCFEHELPYDFRRFTEGGLSNELEAHDFDILYHKKEGNYIQVIAYLWISYIRELTYTKNKYLNILINSIFIFPFTLVGILAHIILPSKKGLYFGIVMLCKKR